MADNQFKRKTAERVADYANDDPLAELARVVGYDHRSDEPDDDVGAPDTGVDLEAELLRELHDTQEDDLREARGFAEPGHADDRRQPESVEEFRGDMEDASYDHEQLSEEIGFSLEDELMRELQDERVEIEASAEAVADCDSASAGPSESQAPRDEVPDVRDFAIVPESIRKLDGAQPFDPAVWGESAVSEASADPAHHDAPEMADDELTDEAGGFAFPSEDELEEDEQFSANQWDWNPPAVDERANAASLFDTADEAFADYDAEPQEALAEGPPPVAEPTWMEKEAASTEDEPPSAASGILGPAGERDNGPAPTGSHGASPDEILADPAQDEAAGSEPAWSVAGEASSAANDEAGELLQEISFELDESAHDAPEAEPDEWVGDGLSGRDFETRPEDRGHSTGPSAEEAGTSTGRVAETAFFSAADDASRMSPARSRASNVVRLDRHEAEDAYADRAREVPVNEVLASESAEFELPVAEDAHAAMFDSSDMEAALAEELAKPEQDDAGAPAAIAESGRVEDTRLQERDAVRATAPEAIDEGVSETAADPVQREPSVLETATAVKQAPAADGAPAFDPAALIEHDEKVEPTFELDVPRLPGDEEKPSSEAQDDFQMDLDSDIIDLFKVDEAEAPPASANGPAADGEDELGNPAARTAQVAAADAVQEKHAAATARFESVAPASIDFDDLERALDEDFEKGAMSSFGERDRDRVAEVVVGGPPAVARRGSRFRGIGVGVAAIVLVGAIAVLGWEFMQSDVGSTAGGGPRIIEASKEPVKQKPANPGGKAVPNQNKIVYDKVDGSKSEGPRQKSLVSSTETPMDVVQRTLQPDLPRNAGAARGGMDGMAGGAGGPQSPSGQAESAAGGKSQARLAPDLRATSAAPTSDAPTGLVPHYVQTMTVTADGRLVPSESDAASAASSSNGSAAPSSAQAPEASQEASVALDQSVAAPAAADRTPAASQTQPVNQNAQGSTPPPLPVARPKTAAAEVTAPETAAPQPPAPKASGQQQPVVASRSPAEAKPPAAQTVAADASASSAPSTGVNPGEYMIQIASQPTEAGAKASYRNLAKRYASVIGGKAVAIQKADIPGKGVYYRVRIAAGSRQDAITLCQNYRAAGGSCYVAH